MEPEQNLSPNDQHTGHVESYFDFFASFMGAALQVHVISSDRSAVIT